MGGRGKGEWLDELAGQGVGLVPLIGGFLERPVSRLSKAVREEHQRARSRALAAAERVSGMSREDIGERVADNPRLVPLVTRVLYLVGMNNQDEMLDLLGAALGEAAAEPDRADDVDMILAGMANLRAEHVRVLVAMTGSPRWVRRRDGQEPQEVDSTAWNGDALANATGLSVDVAWQCVHALENAGFVRSRPMSGFAVSEPSTGYYVTDLGLSVLAVMRQHRDAD